MNVAPGSRPRENLHPAPEPALEMSPRHLALAIASGPRPAEPEPARVLLGGADPWGEAWLELNPAILARRIAEASPS